VVVVGEGEVKNYAHEGHKNYAHKGLHYKSQYNKILREVGMSQLKLVVVLIFAFLLVLLAVTNQPQVSMNLFFWKTPEVSLIVFVFAAILLGGIFATVLGMVTQVKFRKDLGAKKKEIKELEERVVKLQLAAGKSEEVKKEEKKPSPEIEPQE